MSTSNGRRTGLRANVLNCVVLSANVLNCVVLSANVLNCVVLSAIELNCIGVLRCTQPPRRIFGLTRMGECQRSLLCRILI